MKERVKQAWARRPRMSRGQRIVRNLLLCLLVLLYLWGLLDYPLPTAELERRRLEQQNLAGQTELLLEIQKQDSRWDQEAQTSTPLQIMTHFVGMGEGYAVSAVLDSHRSVNSRLEVWPFDQQPGEVKLVPLLGLLTDWRREDWSDYINCCAVLLPEVPEGTVRGEMELWDQGGNHYLEESGTLESGAYLFSFRHAGSSFSSGWIRGQPYILRLYQADGSLLLEQRGTVPDNRETKEGEVCSGTGSAQSSG